MTACTLLIRHATAVRFKHRGYPSRRLVLHHLLIKHEPAATRPKWNIDQPSRHPQCGVDPLRDVALVASPPGASNWLKSTDRL